MMLELIHPIWSEWNSRYSEPHRAYHTAHHIFYMFNVAKKEKIPLCSNEMMAIWLHDIIYNVPKGDKSNEMLSAKYAKKYINDHLAAFKMFGVIPEIVDGIIQDTEHGYQVSRVDSANVLDLDLWVLSSWRLEDYKLYTSLIAKEFIPAFGETDFIQGRAEWIDAMLARDSIYVGSHTPLEFERIARKNLRLEYEAMNDPEEYRTEYLQL